MILQNLTPDAFSPFGTIIRCEAESTEKFQVIVKEPEAGGWRIALSRLTRGKIEKLGLHPNTRESFEPMQGISVLFVSQKETPGDLKVFLLDEPVCLHKNIWHSTAALSRHALIKITENNHVESLEHFLETPLDIGILT